MTAIIRIEHLVNQFGTQRVHDDLNLSINQGEVLGIVGGSGSGKSVLLRTILGLNQPTSGAIYFQEHTAEQNTEHNLLQMPARELTQLRQRWGVMFQRGALFSSLNVADNILFPLREFSQLSRAESYALMTVRLQMVGLAIDVARKFPADLSGGMIKRVALARALVLDPAVLFLDEPTSGLDPVAAEEFDQLIATLHRNLGLTVVMVTHDLDSLSSVCDRVGILVDKQMISDSLQALLHHPNPRVQQYFNSNRARSLKGKT